jgi:hypothetical protein
MLHQQPLLLPHLLHQQPLLLLHQQPLLQFLHTLSFAVTHLVESPHALEPQQEI